MKHLFLTKEQARQLGEDLLEYARMKDSNDRDLFTGFELRFGDLFAKELQPGEMLELHPIPGCCEINDDSDTAAWRLSE